MQPLTSYSRESPVHSFTLSDAPVRVEGSILKMQPREGIWERLLLRGMGRCGNCGCHWRVWARKAGGHRRRISTGKSKTTRGQGSRWESESDFVPLQQGTLDVAGDGWNLLTRLVL